MISLLIWLLILILIFGTLYYVVTLIPLPPPFKTAAMVVLLLIFVVILLAALGGFVGVPKFVAASTLVWAFRPLKELHNATGFVECDEALAERLIADGSAQDPRVGALALRDIETMPEPQCEAEESSVEYDTKVLTPKRRR